MKKQHAGSGKPQGSLNRGTQPRPSPTHAGSGMPKGRVHAAPSHTADSSNYSGQKLRRK
jgi:hypothetical protein